MIEQITYLLFIRRLDEMQMLAEKKARNTGVIESPWFPPGKQHLRWSRLKNEAAEDMYATVSDEVFPFLRTLGGDGSTYAASAPRRSTGCT